MFLDVNLSGRKGVRVFDMTKFNLLISTVML